MKPKPYEPVTGQPTFQSVPNWFYEYRDFDPYRLSNMEAQNTVRESQAALSENRVQRQQAVMEALQGLGENATGSDMLDAVARAEAQFGDTGNLVRSELQKERLERFDNPNDPANISRVMNIARSLDPESRQAFLESQGMGHLQLNNDYDRMMERDGTIYGLRNDGSFNEVGKLPSSKKNDEIWMKGPDDIAVVDKNDTEAQVQAILHGYVPRSEYVKGQREEGILEQLMRGQKPELAGEEEKGRNEQARQQKAARPSAADYKARGKSKEEWKEAVKAWEAQNK